MDLDKVRKLVIELQKKEINASLCKRPVTKKATI